MKRIEIPTGLARKELFEFLLKNKEALIQQKRLIGKACDGYAFHPEANLFNIKGEQLKASSAGVIVSPGDIVNVKTVINTTNWLDSHLDVHLPKLWKKSLDENKRLLHLQEHDMEFDKVIASGKDVRAYTRSMTWKELGFNYAGSTEALVFDSDVRKSRNPYMYDQYLQGWVDNHSVYMQYVKIVMCINEPNHTGYGAEYEAWEKYLPEIVNKEFAEEMGYFWAVSEAKIIEGSAVVRGSNIVTPTLSVIPKSEPPTGTPKNEPGKTTRSLVEVLKTKNIFA